jgi:hypothetical protein
MDAAAMDASAFCDPETPAQRFRGHYMEAPAKGIYARAGAELLRGRENGTGAASNGFDRRDATYSLGLKYDWSVDSVIGLSVSRLGSEVSSREAGDSRRNDIRGTLVEGRYDGYFLGKYPFSISGFYGAVKTGGGGLFNHDAYRWVEADHDSAYYGLKAMFRVPLIFRDQYKMIAEIGLDYRKLKSDPYSFTFDGVPFPALRPARTSESLLIPVGFTFKKDFPQSWGIVTPGIGLGVAYELKDTSNGLRSWHASSAAFRGDEYQFHPLEGEHWKGAVGTVLLGVEARTVGGWELRANYAYTAAGNYAENRFTLELGKCF